MNRICLCVVCFCFFFLLFFFFQAEDGIRDLVRSRGLGDVYKRQELSCTDCPNPICTSSNDRIYYLEVSDEFGCISRDSIQVLSLIHI